MHVKFRLGLDAQGNRVTKVYFVESDGKLELITQMTGWIGLDFDNMSHDNVNKIADAIASKADGSKYIG